MRENYEEHYKMLYELAGHPKDVYATFSGHWHEVIINMLSLYLLNNAQFRKYKDNANHWKQGIYFAFLPRLLKLKGNPYPKRKALYKCSWEMSEDVLKKHTLEYLKGINERYGTNISNKEIDIDKFYNLCGDYFNWLFGKDSEIYNEKTGEIPSEKVYAKLDELFPFEEVTDVKFDKKAQNNIFGNTIFDELE